MVYVNEPVNDWLVLYTIAPAPPPPPDRTPPEPPPPTTSTSTVAVEAPNTMVFVPDVAVNPKVARLVPGISVAAALVPACVICEESAK